MKEGTSIVTEEQIVKARKLSGEDIPYYTKLSNRLSFLKSEGLRNNALLNGVIIPRVVAEEVLEDTLLGNSNG